MLLDRLAQIADLRKLGSTKLATIGPGTTEALAAYRLRADLQPTDAYRAEALAEALAADAHGKRFLLVRASRGREVLADDLRARGGQVDQVVAYRSVDVEQPQPEIAEALAAGKIDFVTVTSSAIARSLAAMFGADLAQTQLASISPITSRTLRELGFDPSCEARSYTVNGLIEAMLALAESASSAKTPDR
jgi:uroporphyrinogen III methyltransferase/synthase